MNNLQATVFNASWNKRCMQGSVNVISRRLLLSVFVLLCGHVSFAQDKTFDLWAQDLPTDVGTEPNTISSYFYGSLDIWVKRHDISSYPLADQETQEDPVGGQPNFLYVKIRNKGTADFPGTATAGNKVKVYWAKASTGLAWPSPWDGSLSMTNTNNHSVPLGGLIGTADIPAIPAGGVVRVAVNWTPPNPNEYDFASLPGSSHKHFCLLARIGKEPDPPFGLSVTGILGDYVKNNNKVIWKNIGIEDPVTDPGGETAGLFMIGNYSKDAYKGGIRINVLGEGTGFMKYAEVKVTLGKNVTEWWLKGNNFTHESDSFKMALKQHGIELRGNDFFLAGNMAAFENILFAPQQVDGIKFSLKLLEKAPAGVKDLQIRIEQVAVIGGKEMTLGGVIQSFPLVKEDGGPVTPPPPPVTEPGSNYWIWILIGIVILILLFLLTRRKK
ncbi:hypothetical protein [Chitinophaga sp. MM2321]|uniref:hypothetical protein n=1 Tax=Chitinophaga sp. MM2321 TaxID=3137178 RepID=UPI0032D570C5